MADKLIINKEKVTTLFNKIRTKAGVTGPKTFDEMNDVVDSIQTGGGSTGDGKYRIRYLDIDGTVLKEEYLNEGNSLTPPDNPSYDTDYLVFDTWNYDIANVVVDRDYDIGAIYNTIDNSTYMFCRFTTNTGLNPTLAINGSPTIDWGDGTVDSNLSHTYASEGNYIIKITGSFTFNTSSTIYLLNPTNSNLNTSLNKIYISSNVTSIGGSAFKYCYSLKNISIPNSVTSIGSSVFNECNSLQSVSIPNSVTSIEGVFYNCYGLQSVSIPNGVTSIGNNTFYYCYTLQSVSIPNGVTSIGNTAFFSCYQLQSIVIPNGVTSIGNDAFSGCTGLTSITIPESVTSIGRSVFNGCRSLQSVSIPNGVTSIGNNAFYNCPFQSIAIPNGVTSIGNNAFYTCYRLQSVSIPSSVTSIGSQTFQSCYAITNYFILCNEVPTLANTTAFTNINKSCIIWVNNEIYKELRTATNWSTYASYMKRLSECPQDLLDENGIERPTPEPEPSGFTATFQATSMYSDYGYYSVDGGNTWTQVTMDAVSVENVTQVKLKVASHEYAMPASWNWGSNGLNGSSANKEVISETITLTENTTFEYVCYD